METIYKGITPGTEIVDSHGHAVGKVHEVVCNDADQLVAVTVQRGLLFKTDVTVPAAAIARTEGGKIYLAVERDALADMLKPEADLQAPPATQVANTGTSGLQANVVHDIDTGAATHERGLGTAGAPGLDAGNLRPTPGGAGPERPTESQEPTSHDRT